MTCCCLVCDIQSHMQKVIAVDWHECSALHAPSLSHPDAADEDDDAVREVEGCHRVRAGHAQKGVKHERKQPRDSDIDSFSCPEHDHECTDS